MGFWSLSIAAAACGAVASGGWGLYAAMSLGTIAVATSAIGFRRRRAAAASRLACAGGLGLATGALVLALTKYGLTLAAINELAALR